jgi:DNA-binding transcriptional ArsR family regulator
MSRVSEVSPNLLIKKTKFAPRTISRHLAVLVEQGIITKKGQRPKVVYSLKQTLSV